MEVLNRRALNQRVAELLGIPARDVADVTDAFIHEMFLALVNNCAVRLEGFGTLSVCVVEAKKLPRRSPAWASVLRKYYVKFRKSDPLGEALQAKHGRSKTRRTDDGQVRSRRKRRR